MAPNHSKEETNKEARERVLKAGLMTVVNYLSTALLHCR